MVSRRDGRASSRLLDSTNSPETRLVRVSLLLDQGYISGCLCLIICHIFLSLIPSLSLLLLLPSLSFLQSPCVLTQYYLLWRLCSESSGQKIPPLPALYAIVLLMVFLMAADRCREPLALGLGVQCSFNKSQSVLCHYINIFSQLLWRSGGAALYQSLWYVGTEETSGAANPRKRTIKSKRWIQEKLRAPSSIET